MALRTFALATLFIAGFSFAAGQPYKFTPQAGFGGESEGNGTLKLFLGKPRPFHVVSHGTEQSDGSFRLEQRVAFEGKPPQDRVWILTTVSPDHYSATLSDASGPATGFTSGSRLCLRYRVKGPLVMHQELQLMSDGKTIDNVGVITLLGIPIGRLHETIERKDPGLTSNNSIKSKPTPIPDYEDRDQPVSVKDLEILDRANTLLANESAWSRKDTRECPPGAKSLSLFCALQKASIEVLGAYDHRRAALQEVRFAIEDATAGREFEHRLMDYNNLPETQFSDIKNILVAARAKVSARSGAEGH
ncbi:MAG: DUF3833 family protein [Pseudoxanthomonas sp.]